MARAKGRKQARQSNSRGLARLSKDRGDPQVGIGPPSSGAFTPERRQRFLLEYSRGGTVAEAAEAVGVSSVTIYSRVRSDPTFAAQFALSQDYNTDQLEDRLARMASGNVAALFGTLKARRPHKWRDNVKVEVQHTTGAEALREARRRVAEANSQSATVAQPQPGDGDVAPTQH